MNLALEQSSNNPVYYAQYAHAKLCSILESGKDIPFDKSGKLLKAKSETAILKHLADFPKVVNDAANEKAVYKITLMALVYGMLLESGNDAANVTAFAISGNITNFAKKQ